MVMYRYIERFDGTVQVDKIFWALVAAKSKMWRNIAAKIELGEIDDKHLVYGADSLHVSCDGWSWSVDAA